jgi:hypothetical protein
MAVLKWVKKSLKIYVWKELIRVDDTWMKNWWIIYLSAHLLIRIANKGVLGNVGDHCIEQFLNDIYFGIELGVPADESGQS